MEGAGGMMAWQGECRTGVMGRCGMFGGDQTRSFKSRCANICS